MIVVDSSVWIDNLRAADNEQAVKLSSIREPRNILVGDFILFEVLRGARDDRHAAEIEAELRKFVIAPMFSPALAPIVAANDRRLRSLGITIRKSIDLIISTFCIEHDHVLLHRDRDFSAMEMHLGLQVF